MIEMRRAVLAIPLLLAACSGAGSPTPAGQTPNTATPAGNATVAPSAAAATAGATTPPSTTPSEPAASPAPSADTAATPGAPLGELDGLIPTEVAGNVMTIEPASNPARSFMILWNDEQVAQDLLDDLGASADDIDVVFSYPEGDVYPNRIYVDAYRVAGADGIALRDGFVENYSNYYEQSTTVEVTDETIGGKQVKRLDFPEAPDGQEQYFYAVGDIVFVVSANPSEWLENALSQLP